MKFNNEKREGYLRQAYCQNHMSDSFLRIHGAMIKEWELDNIQRMRMGDWQKSTPFFDDISPKTRFAIASERVNESKTSIFSGTIERYPSKMSDISEGQNSLSVEHYKGYIPATRNSNTHSARIDGAQDSSICMTQRLNFLREEASTPGLIRLVCPIGINRIKHKEVQQRNADDFTFFEGDLPKPVLVDDDCHQEIYVCEPIPSVTQLDKSQTILSQPLDSILGTVVQEPSSKVVEKEPIKKISRKRKSTQAPTLEKIRRK